MAIRKKSKTYILWIFYLIVSDKKISSNKHNSIDWSIWRMNYSINLEGSKSDGQNSKRRVKYGSKMSTVNRWEEMTQEIILLSANTETSSKQLTIIPQNPQSKTD